MAADFSITLSTNITPLTARRIDRFAEMKLGPLQMSFCGHDRKSYETTYVGAKFEHVVDNLRRVAEVFPAAPSHG